MKANRRIMMSSLTGETYQSANDLLIRFKPFMLTVLLVLGGSVGFPATLQSDMKGPPKYSDEEIHRAITVYAKRYHLDPALLRAVIKAESNFRQDAISRRGAVGLMQLMPPTAVSLQVADIHDPLQNIQGGAKQLQHLLNLYHGNLRLALAAYNAGVHRVKRDVPRIRETRVYIEKVLAHYNADRGHYKVENEKRGAKAA